MTAQMQTGNSTPVILLTPEQKRELKEAWEKRHEWWAFVALQNDTHNRKQAEEMNHIQDLKKDIYRIREMYKARNNILIQLWVWLKDALSHASKSADKIRIE